MEEKQIGDFPLFSLLLVTALAAFVPLLAARMRPVRLPIVVAEITVGIIIGRSGLNLIEESNILNFLAEFGFVYLMFISGLEVIPGNILPPSVQGHTRRWLHPLVLGMAIFLTTLGLSFALAKALYWQGWVQNVWFVALILSTTSLGIVVPVLKERGLLASGYGQYLLTAALAADFTALLLLSLSVAIFSYGVTLELLLVLVLLVAFAIVARVGQFFANIPALNRLIEELSHATAQIQVRGALALMVAWVVLAEALGTEIILGAFLAGTIVSLLTGPRESLLREKLDALGFGFFIPIFFIMVGTRFNLEALTGPGQALLLVPLLLFAAYTVKLLPSLLLRLVFSWKESLAGGILLSARLSLIIAISAIALELKVISEAVNNAVILVTMVTCTVSPLLFHRMSITFKTGERRGVILVGDDQLTELLAKRLHRTGKEVIVVSRDGRRLGELRRHGVRVCLGEPTARDTLARAGAAETEALLALLPDPESNLKLCQIAREEFNIPTIVARADDPARVTPFLALNVRVVQPSISLALEAALRFPTMFDLLIGQGEDMEISEAVLRNPSLNGRPLKHLHLPGGAVVIGIQRHGEILVLHQDTELRQGDTIILLGHPSTVEAARSWIEQRVS